MVAAQGGVNAGSERHSVGENLDGGPVQEDTQVDPAAGHRKRPGLVLHINSWIEAAPGAVEAERAVVAAVGGLRGSITVPPCASPSAPSVRAQQTQPQHSTRRELHVEFKVQLAAGHPGIHRGPGARQHLSRQAHVSRRSFSISGTGANRRVPSSANVATRGRLITPDQPASTIAASLRPS